MKRALGSLLILFTVFGLAGCTNDTEDPLSDVEIKVAADIDGVHGPAISHYGIPSSFNNELKTSICVSTVSRDYSVMLNAPNTGLSFVEREVPQPFAEGLYFPLNAEVVYLRGVSPMSMIWTISGADIRCEISGCEDIMVTPEYSLTRAEAEAGDYPLLRYKRALALLNLRVWGEDISESIWGKINRIELINTQKKMSAMLTANNTVIRTFTARYPEGDVLDCYIYDSVKNKYTDWRYRSVKGYSIPVLYPGQDTAVKAYVMAAPVYAEAGLVSYTFKIYTTLFTDGVDVPVSLADKENAFTGNTAGYKFDIELAFEATGITGRLVAASEWK